MNQLTNAQLTVAIRNMATTNDAAKRLFKSFSGRQKDARETNVERAAWLATTDYQTMLAIFKELDGIGAGAFVVGRHGYSSRMVWKFSIRSIGEIGLGESSLPEDVAADAVAEDLPENSDDDLPNHTGHDYQLRPSTKIRLNLPTDLTEKEADRLASYIKTLPF